MKTKLIGLNKELITLLNQNGIKSNTDFQKKRRENLLIVNGMSDEFFKELDLYMLKNNLHFKDQDHPEQEKDEIFVTNLFGEDQDIDWYKTKRLGNIAYNRQGTIVADGLPMFVKKTEFDENIRENITT